MELFFYGSLAVAQKIVNKKVVKNSKKIIWRLAHEKVETEKHMVKITVNFSSELFRQPDFIGFYSMEKKLNYSKIEIFDGNVWSPLTGEQLVELK